MNSLDLFNKIRNLIILATNIPNVILADQNSPAPEGSYCVVRPKQTIRKKAVNNQKIIDEVTTTTTLDIDCSINFYRTGAMDYAEELQGADRLPAIREQLLRDQIGWFGIDSINNLTFLQSDQSEERAQCNLRLWYKSTKSTILESIEKVSVIVEYENSEEIETIEIGNE